MNVSCSARISPSEHWLKDERYCPNEECGYVRPENHESKNCPKCNTFLLKRVKIVRFEDR